MQRPLADEIRPKTLDEVVGQRHLLAKGAVLRRLIDSGTEANMVFYGPSGTGKTTIANIIARQTNKTLHRLNATTASLQDVKDIIADVGTLLAPGGILLYLDEIQYFNKKQQQSLLEFMENGSLTLIASTTENPYFYVYGALLSRSTVFEFKAVSPEEVEPAVLRALKIEQDRAPLPLDWEEAVPRQIATACGGDVRKAINAVELLCQAALPKDGKLTLTLADAEQVAQRSAMRYDKGGDAMYDAASALMKSLRGSDPDAALHYLARFLEAGDLITPCRRLLCSASEDVGMAYPQASLHREGLRGHRHAAGAAGGPAAPGPGGRPAGHGPQVQQRDGRHRQSLGGREGGPHRGRAPGAAERPRGLRRHGAGAGLLVPPQLPPPLGAAAVPARCPEGRPLLRIRRQQDGAGRQAVLGGYQGPAAVNTVSTGSFSYPAGE